MSTDSIVGRRISRFAGLLESRQTHPPIEGYTAVVEFDDGSVVLISQSDFAWVDEWPADCVDIPFQSLDVDLDLVGSVVTAVFRSSSTRFEGHQLWLLLDALYVLGLVNTQQGTKLHAEPLLTAPWTRGATALYDPSELYDLDNNKITLDSLLLD